MSRYDKVISRERLLEALRYDPDTGHLIWKIKRPGQVAGCVTASGYRTVGIDGHVYYAHVLVWMFVHNAWPERDIDHKDRDPGNNRHTNLRLVSEAQNQWNTSPRKTNTSGQKGVFSHRDKWMVQISKNKKRYYIGYFSDFDTACEAQRAAYARLHGEFVVV